MTRIGKVKRLRIGMSKGIFVQEGFGEELERIYRPIYASIKGQ